MQPIKWSFLNQETGQNVDGLDFEQARFVTSMIDHKTRMAWLVWHDGLADWMNLDECDQLIGTVTRQRPIPPIPPNRPGAKKSNPAPQEGEMSQILVTKHESKSEHNDKRVHRRFRKNFQVEIMTPTGAIKVVTENISHGGMMFQTALPEQVARTFSATIVRSNKARLQVFCKQIRPPRGAPETGCRRVQFLRVEEYELLNAWLLDRAIE